MTDTNHCDVAALTVDDRTTLVLVEHLDRIDPGVSVPLHRLFHDHLVPALTDEDGKLRDWLAHTRPTPGTDPTFHRQIRKLAHAHRTIPQGPGTMMRWLLRAEAQDVRRSPSAPRTALVTTRPWRRIWRSAVGVLRTRQFV